MVWDTDKNGLIDALELFSGMAIFSSAKYEDIIRCIRVRFFLYNFYYKFKKHVLNF